MSDLTQTSSDAEDVPGCKGTTGDPSARSCRSAGRPSPTDSAARASGPGTMGRSYRSALDGYRYSAACKGALKPVLRRKIPNECVSQLQKSRREWPDKADMASLPSSSPSAGAAPVGVAPDRTGAAQK